MQVADVKAVIKKHGTSINAVAEKLGFTRQNFHHLKGQGNKLSIDQLNRMAEAIGCDTSELLVGTSDFCAFVHINGKNYTFDNTGELKAFLETI